MTGSFSLSQIWQRKEPLGGNLLLCGEFSREIQKVRGAPKPGLSRGTGGQNATFYVDTLTTERFNNQALILSRLQGLCCRHSGAQPIC